MRKFRRAAFAVAMIAATLAIAAPAAAQAPPGTPAASPEGKAGETPAISLPQPLTRDAVRALMSRISDAEARQLLLQQLDRVAVQDAAPDVVTMMDSFEEALPDLKNRLTLMVSAIPDLPRVGPIIVDTLTDGEPSRIWKILLYVVVIFAGGFVGERLFRRLFSRNIAHPQGERTSGIHKAFVLGLRLIVDLLGIAVFALCALGLFFVFYQGHEPVRQAVGALYWMIILIRGVAALARFAVAPGAPLLRLPPVGDRTAVKLYRRILWVSASVIIAALFVDLLDEFGMDEGLTLLVGRAVSLMVIGIIIAIIWHDRRTIADMIQPAPGNNDKPSGPVKRLLAANWHILATCYLAGIYVFGTIHLLLTGGRSPGSAITSIVVLIAIPFVDWLMQAALRRLLRAPKKTPLDDDDAGVAAPASEPEPDDGENEYFGVLLNNARIVLAIVVVVALADIWDIDMRGAAAAGIGETVANAIFDIVITLVLASAIWGIVKTAISRQLAAKKRDGGNGGERGRGRRRRHAAGDAAAAFSEISVHHPDRDRHLDRSVRTRRRHRAADRRRRHRRHRHRFRRPDAGARHRLGGFLPDRGRVPGRRVHRYRRRHPGHGGGYLHPIVSSAPSQRAHPHGPVRRASTP